MVGGPRTVAVVRAATVVVLAVGLALPVGPVAAQAGNAQFATLDQAAEFLRTAEIVEVVPVGRGTTSPDRATLELGGVRAYAVFHDVDKIERNIQVGEKRFRVFHDSYLADCAAYELSRVLHIDGVPPTVERAVGGRRGSLQLWIDDATTEEERAAASTRPPDATVFRRRIALMRLFDNLIYNDDRHAGNIVIGPDWTVWLIDHSRAFQRPAELRDAGRVTQVERSFWDRLRTIPDAEIVAAVEPFLDERQLEALLERRGLLVQHLEGLIAERGEGAVLYDAPQN